MVVCMVCGAVGTSHLLTLDSVILPRLCLIVQELALNSTSGIKVSRISLKGNLIDENPLRGLGPAAILASRYEQEKPQVHTGLYSTKKKTAARTVSCHQACSDVYLGKANKIQIVQWMQVCMSWRCDDRLSMQRCWILNLLKPSCLM